MAPGATSKAKFPSMSEMVPFVVPVSTMLAPMSGLSLVVDDVSCDPSFLLLNLVDHLLLIVFARSVTSTYSDTCRSTTL